MVKALKIFIDCPFCTDGTHGEQTCLHCDGTGILDWGQTTPDIGIFHSHIILEAIDETEYDALSDSQRASLQLLLQCGMVDLNDGKAGKTRFWTWFDSESTTRANLAALLT